MTAATRADIDRAAARIGPIDVKTDPASIAAFKAACGGASEAASVPAIFPIRWLAAPEIHAAMLALVGSDHVVVHESQTFTTKVRLELDRAYRLVVELVRTSQPERLTLVATITAPDGEVCGGVETVLRLVERAPKTPER